MTVQLCAELVQYYQRLMNQIKVIYKAQNQHSFNINITLNCYYNWELVPTAQYIIKSRMFRVHNLNNAVVYDMCKIINRF